MQAILFDLDGVIYQGEKPIAGAVATLGWVREQGIPHLFLTNTSSRPRSAIVQKLTHMHITINEHEIFSPAVAAAKWLGSNNTGQAALFVPQATQAEFDGLPLLDQNAEHGAGAVIIGDLGEAWDFTTLNRAFRLLVDEAQPQLIALGMTRYWQAPDGLRLDAAPFVAALEHATGAKALVLGKPAASFFQAALSLLGSSASQTFMVGDDIKGDIGGAQAAGLHGILVRTGKYRPSDLESEIAPYAIIDSIADLPAWWSENILPA
jgi:HAD superfamily hydrolase (TIGR01458 family)